MSQKPIFVACIRHSQPGRGIAISVVKPARFEHFEGIVGGNGGEMNDKSDVPHAALFRISDFGDHLEVVFAEIHSKLLALVVVVLNTIFSICLHRCVQ